MIELAHGVLHALQMHALRRRDCLTPYTWHHISLYSSTHSTEMLKIE